MYVPYFLFLLKRSRPSRKELRNASRWEQFVDCLRYRPMSVLIGSRARAEPVAYRRRSEPQQSGHRHLRRPTQGVRLLTSNMLSFLGAHPSSHSAPTRYKRKFMIHDDDFISILNFTPRKISHRCALGRHNACVTQKILYGLDWAAICLVR